MPSLSEIFNPTFIVFLGILLIVVAFLVVYFESKMREQNHKMASMLSLVSTVAEEMNNINMRINASTTANVVMSNQNVNPSRNNSMSGLIQVSDDSSVSDDDDDDDDETSDNTDSESDENESSDDDDESVSEIDLTPDNVETIEIGNNDVKILKLNVSNENKDDSDDLDINIEDLDAEDANEDEDDDENDLDDDLSSKSSEEPTILETVETETTPQNDFIKTLNLKTINMEDLEEHKDAIDSSIDYKKMNIGKLRSIISEKGLHEDPSKLKKNEILKLLGAE